MSLHGSLRHPAFCWSDKCDRFQRIYWIQIRSLWKSCLHLFQNAWSWLSTPCYARLWSFHSFSIVGQQNSWLHQLPNCYLLYWDNLYCSFHLGRYQLKIVLLQVLACQKCLHPFHPLFCCPFQFLKFLNCNGYLGWWIQLIESAAKEVSMNF